MTETEKLRLALYNAVEYIDCEDCPLNDNSTICTGCKSRLVDYFIEEAKKNDDNDENLL